MKNNNISDLDWSQQLHRTMDGKIDAQRVILVNDTDSIKNEIKVEIDTDKLTTSIRKGLESIVIPQPVAQVQHEPQEIKVVEIEKQVFIKEPDIKIVEIEKPIVIKETEIKVVEIKVPVVVETVKSIEVEKPVIIKEMEIKEIPTTTKETHYLRILAVAEAIALLILIIKQH